MLSQEEVLEQSKSAFAQWEEKWRAYSSINGKIYKKNKTSFNDVAFAGIGKTAVIVGTGPSLERKMPILKKYRDKVEIICNDKSFGMLVNNDIIPDYVVLCDAGINYERWCEPYIGKTVNVKLVSAIPANPKWARHWKGKIYFFVNKDNIQSEKIFSEISGCNEFLPAGSNVGNSSIVFSASVLHYSYNVLIGYDFSWRDTDNYYAYNNSDKRYWMKHMAIIDNEGNLVNTSNNLYFSARWLTDFWQGTIAPSGVHLVDCSDGGISGLPKADFERMLQVIPNVKPVSQKMKENAAKTRAKTEVITNQQGMNRINELLKTKSVMNVSITYLEEADDKWLKELN